jgi:hypothetical protein
VAWHDHLVAGDVDGDGLDDLVCHRPSDGKAWVAFNEMIRNDPPKGNLPSSFLHQDPSFAETGPDGWSYPLAWCDDFDAAGNALDRFGVTDLDGDGAADMWCHNLSLGTTYVLYGHPNKRGAVDTCGPSAAFSCTADWGRSSSDHWCTGASTSAPAVTAADMDGDGRADFVCHGPAAGAKSTGYYPIAGMTR